MPPALYQSKSEHSKRPRQKLQVVHTLASETTQHPLCPILLAKQVTGSASRSRLAGKRTGLRFSLEA